MAKENFLKIIIVAYDHKVLDVTIRKFIEIGNEVHATIKGPIPLPTKKEIFTVLRSPHVNKDSREQFERRTHKRVLYMSALGGKTFEAIGSLQLPSGVYFNFKK
jgi:small subunit ribosomal protein S10